MIIDISGLWILKLDELVNLLESAGCQISRKDISTDATLAHITFSLNDSVGLGVEEKGIILTDICNKRGVIIDREDFSKIEVY